MRIVTHPENIEALREKFIDKVFDDRFRPIFPGVEFIANRDLDVWKHTPTGRIIWPDDPYVEYEDSDAEWALPLGIAEREMKSERLFYEVANTYQPWRFAMLPEFLTRPMLITTCS